MIKSFKIINSAGRELYLDIARPYDTGLAVKNVDGLSPANASINMTKLVNQDGSEYNSSKTESRNVVFTIGILGNSVRGVEGARNDLYEYFRIKDNIRIEINTIYKSLYCTGWVESNEIDMFTNDETATISIVCPDPYMYDVNTQVSSLDKPIPVFEFPFSNESTIQPTMVCGVKNVGDDTVCIRYTGTVQTGFILRVEFGTESLRPTFTHTNTGAFIQLGYLEGETNYLQGDVVEICTINGKKSITLIRKKERHNILYAMMPESRWFQLTPGVNYILSTATNPSSNGPAELNVDVINNIKYVGV